MFHRLGSIEVLRGFATSGLLPTVATEGTLAAFYLALGISGRGTRLDSP